MFISFFYFSFLLLLVFPVFKSVEQYLFNIHRSGVWYIQTLEWQPTIPHFWAAAKRLRERGSGDEKRKNRQAFQDEWSYEIPGTHV